MVSTTNLSFHLLNSLSCWTHRRPLSTTQSPAPRGPPGLPMAPPAPRGPPDGLLFPRRPPEEMLVPWTPPEFLLVPLDMEARGEVGAREVSMGEPRASMGSMGSSSTHSPAHGADLGQGLQGSNNFMTLLFIIFCVTNFKTFYGNFYFISLSSMQEGYMAGGIYVMEFMWLHVPWAVYGGMAWRTPSL